ncbi:MAG TPA: hypothetical protein VJI69_08085 [Bacteroidia bacterium]|nr:hypothetical protein [Bacteroidia bacterium]
MAKIFSLNSKEELVNEIIIDDNFILRDDEFISFEISGGFNWGHHAQICSA